MQALRRRLGMWAFVTVSLHVAMAPLGATRACLTDAHAHRGSAADCPMHHSTGTGSGAAHSHHASNHGAMQHGGSHEGMDHADMHHHAPFQEPSGAQLTCDCSADLISMLSPGAVIVSPRAAVAPDTTVHPSGAALFTGRRSHIPAPLSPPPR